ncbi:MAG TPA: hypothetical protein VIE68_07940 [Gemmatimonadota bacterium]|jgi:hypothetical protein
MSRSVPLSAALFALLLPASVLAQVADTTAADTTSAADTTAADTTSAGVPHELPTLEGFRKIAILSRDMLPGVPGYETWVEIYRGPERAQILRFVTRGVAWAFVVRPAGATDAYTLRDFDCSGGFTEELQAGTPLAVPDCATPAAPAAAPTEDDD